MLLLSLSLLSIYLTNVLELWSMQYLSPTKACFIYGLSPFLTVILSSIYFGEKITKIKILGLLIGFLGFIPVLMSQTDPESFLKVLIFLSPPDFAMIGAVFFLFTVESSLESLLEIRHRHQFAQMATVC